MTDVAENVKINNTEYLHNLFQNPHWNAWFELDYGGNPEGIFTAACPPKALHALENGIYMLFLKKYFKTFLPKQLVDYLATIYINGT